MLKDLLLFGVPAIALIAALVQYAKVLGVAERWQPGLAMILGVVGCNMIVVASLYPFLMPWLEATVVGITAGLSAVGLYSAGTHLLALRR
jgi:hypothetical protein